jgi:hypothetical protein
MNNFSLPKVGTTFAWLVSLVGAVSFAGSVHAENSARTAFQSGVIPVVKKFATKTDIFTPSIIATKGSETLGVEASTLFPQPDLLALGRWAEKHVCWRTSRTLPSGKKRLIPKKTALSSSYSSLANFTDSEKESLKTLCGLRWGESSFYPYERVYGR